MALTTVVAAPPARPRVLLIGTAMVTGAVIMLFGGLLGIYLGRRSGVVEAGQAWLPAAADVPLTQPNVMLMGLMMGSVTIQWAAYAIGRDDRVNAYVALGLTALIGVAYVNMGAYLYTLMGLDIDTSETALLINVISGAHLAMVLAAVVFAVLMVFRALGGQYTSRQHDGVSAAALFWHASTFVFFLIWLVIYVTK
jgi:heme/copper-type cytochrome/quinol oxidase subunit 3